MSTEASIQITSPNKTTEQVIDQNLYLLFIDGEIETSESDGPVKLEFADGIVTVKIQDDVENASFSGHPLRKGAIYFLEDDDSISFGESKITLKSSSSPSPKAEEIEEDIDLFELHATENKDEAEKESESTSNDELILEVDQLIADSDESEEKIEGIEEDNTEPKIQFNQLNEDNSEDLTHGEFSLDAGSQTRTSIAVHEILQTHNKKNNNVPKEALAAQREELKKVRSKSKKKKKKSRADQDLDLDGASRFKITEKSQGKKKKAKVKIVIPTENTVGPIVRILGVISSVAMAVFANRYVDIAPLAPIVDKFEGLINQELTNRELSEIPYGVFEVLTIFILVELISRVLFSVSLPHFIAGVTNYGSFVTKRVKAIVKLPLDLFSIICPIGEIPVIIGKKSVKELVTLSQTRYRSPFFKLLAPFTIIIATIFFCYQSILTTQVLKPEQFSTYSTITNYKEKKSTKISSLSLSRGVADKYYIDGISTGRPYFLFAHKENKTLLEYRTLAKYEFKKLFSKIADKAPFFEYTHPFLYQYLEDGKSNKKVREDVLRLIKSGELTNYKIPNLLTSFDPLLANEAHQLFKRFGIKVDGLMSANSFYRIYRQESDYYALYISEHNIYSFLITTSDEMSKKAITSIHFQPAKEGTPKTDLESGSSDYENKVRPLLHGELGEVDGAIIKRYLEITQKKVPADF